MGQTLVEKLSAAHLAEPRARRVAAGEFVTIRPAHVLTHDNTAPVIEKFRALGAQRLHDPRQAVIVLDHDIQNDSLENLTKYRAIEAFAREQGITFFPAGSGIGHQIVVEQLYARPGAFVVAADSHANMYGALSALGTPVVRTDAAVIWATGELWWQVPRSIEVRLEGRRREGTTGKDVIIALCALYRAGEVQNAVVEFGGPGVATLGIEERLTIANMTTEWGALAGWFPVDEVTLDYLRRRAARGARAVGPEDLARWATAPPRPDPDARYAGRITLDLGEVEPHVSGPDTVTVATPLAEVEARRIPIHKAYLVSCVNSRAGDLAAAAAVVRGRQIAPGVELYVAAASREVEADARESGAWQDLLRAGARPLPAGCGPCIGLGAGLLEPGEVGISATNRNFKGRMGSRDAECYLASPAVVAASAIAGYIRGPLPSHPHRLAYRFEAHAATTGPASEPAAGSELSLRIRGRVVLLPRDDIDTDGIYGKEHTYRDRTSREMGDVVFANYDPELARRLRDGDVLVGGRNFGTGSSREQAVTALAARGIAAIVAASYSWTYLRNAFNHGLPCVVCPDLVFDLRRRFASDGGAAVIPGDEIAIDFAAGSITHEQATYRFPRLGPVPQSLIAAGGIEPFVRARLGPRGA